MIGYGQTVQKKNRDLWRRMERLVKKIKHLQLVGKERRRSQFHQKNHGDRPNYRNDGRQIRRKIEQQIRRKIEQPE